MSNWHCERLKSTCSEFNKSYMITSFNVSITELDYFGQASMFILLQFFLVVNSIKIFTLLKKKLRCFN